MLYMINNGKGFVKFFGSAKDVAVRERLSDDPETDSPFVIIIDGHQFFAAYDGYTVAAIADSGALISQFNHKGPV